MCSALMQNAQSCLYGCTILKFFGLDALKLNSPSSIRVNLACFGRDLKLSAKVALDFLKQGIICRDCCTCFIVPEYK